MFFNWVSTFLLYLLIGCIFALPYHNNNNGNKAIENHKNYNLLPIDKCGISQTSDKIVFGTNADLGEFPWMAVLLIKENNKLRYHCAGSIITNQHILTAAHCVAHLKPADLVIRLGEYAQETNPDCVDIGGAQDCAAPYVEVGVKKITVHSDFNHSLNLLTNDIAVLKTAKIDFTSEYIRPICLPVGDFRRALKGVLIVTGWGYTEKNALSDKLQKASVDRCDFDQCQLYYDTQYLKNRKNALDENRHLCSIAKSFSCYGDSGGPLHSVAVVGGDVRYVEAAITSFGPESGCSSHNPTVNTNVEYYMPWILDSL